MKHTVSLYLELNENEKPDFEVVGLAAAAFAEAIKEIAYVLDPGMEVRLEFDGTSEGSLSLRALFKALKTRDGQAGTAIGVILGTSIAFVGDVRSWTVEKLLDQLFLPEQRQQLSEEDITRIGDACRGVADGKIAKVPFQKVYKQLERDNTIKSVGTITMVGTKPPDPVPHSDFQIRAGIAGPLQTSPNDRIIPSTERLTLVSPVLLPEGRKRVWRFLSPFGEFSYHVKDRQFFDDILRGRTRLTIKAGIQITAEIDTLEKYEGGVWVPKKRTISKVVRIHRRRGQPDLFTQQPKKHKTRKKKKS